jgi:hypothetical protein
MIYVSDAACIATEAVSVGTPLTLR